MGRFGASLGRAELRLLNRLGRAEAQATLNTVRMATGRKIDFASEDPTRLVPLTAATSLASHS